MKGDSKAALMAYWWPKFQMFYMVAVMVLVVTSPAHADIAAVLQRITDFCTMVIESLVWPSVLLLAFMYHLVLFFLKGNDVTNLVKAMWAGVGGGVWYGIKEIWSQITQ